MGISTNLNTAPYHDDFNENIEKQYIRVLFKPARAVQARELTQLQSILQNQIERFGNNIFQEGTIIEGVNPTIDKDIRFVKVRDQSGIDDLTIYASTDDVSYFITGSGSGLKAKIVAGANGFESDAPNLKTFFVKYLQSSLSTEGFEVKQFIAGETLKVTREVELANETIEVTEIATVTSADVINNVGQSLGVRVTDGIIYQRGHFNFVASQLVIASKYNTTPEDISVGFDIQESIVDSALDSTLLDNAQGFNNQNAPGADRLKLEPKLAVYNTATRPESFFALIRIERGEPVFVRGDTEFKSIKQELAKRTDDESGSYVVNGLDIATEKDVNGNFYAVVGAGKAYAFGYEINNIGNTRLKIDPSTVINKKEQQSTGVKYGSYFEVDISGSNGTQTFENVDQFATEEYNLYAANGTTLVGTCRVRNVEIVSDDTARIYVFAINKVNAQRNTTIAKFGNASSKTDVGSSNIIEANNAAQIFDTGRGSISSISNLSYTMTETKIFGGAAGLSPSGNFDIPAETNTPLSINPVVGNGLVIGLTKNGKIAKGNCVPYSGGIRVTFANLADTTNNYIKKIYYKATITGSQQDTLTANKIWVSTNFSVANNFASLGIPNALKIHQVLLVDGDDEKDVTSKILLTRNQNDTYYGLSYVTAKSGESLGPESNYQLLINFTTLQRSNLGKAAGQTYLTHNSYAGISEVADLLVPYTARNGKTYNPLNSVDFRPYAQPTAQYIATKAGASTVTYQSLDLGDLSSSSGVANNTHIMSDQEYYLPRIDKIGIDKSQTFVITKGEPADNPGKVVNSAVFGLADIFVPGSNLSKAAMNSLKVEKNTTKNYTMKEIEKIEKRVDRLVDIVSLSLLESKTKDMFIPDGSGNNRFKNGILVDQFKDSRIADITHPEHRAFIDWGQQVLTPSVTQFPIDLKIDSATSSNVSSYDDIISLSFVSRQTLLEQEYATSFRNLASNFYSYKGTLSMEPRFDAEYDVTQNPDVTIDIDIATPVTDLVDNIQELMPLTTNISDNTSSTETMDGDFRVTTITNTVTTQSLDSTIYNTKQNLGTYITDLSMKPFMNSKVVKIAVAGLRPNTRHYFYFDEIPVSTFVIPGIVYEIDVQGRSIKPSDVSPNGEKGDAVLTDEFGRLFAIFHLPESTFLVGDADMIISDSDQFNSIESAGTSIAKTTYRAYNFAIGQSALSSEIRSVDFDIGSSTFATDREVREFVPPPPAPPAESPTPTAAVRTIPFFTWTRNWFAFFGGSDPLAQTFQVQPAQAEYASCLYTDKIDLWFKKKSPASRKNGITVQIREVLNGYPTAAVVDYGEKHVDWGQINVSGNAQTATSVVFDNPVRLKVGDEYAIVVVPDATDPDYFIWTAKVGENSITDDSVQITSDWGSGMLFTSTNNKAWKSYQNEDIKFKLYKTEFSTSPGHIDLVPNDMEFFRLDEDTSVGAFINDEYAYQLLDTNYAGAFTNGRVTCTVATGFDIEIGDLVVINSTGRATHVTEVKNITSTGNTHALTLDQQPPFPSNTSVTVTIGVGGKVTHFDGKDRSRLHVKESTSKQTKRYTFNTGSDESKLTGSISGATARITEIFNAPVSYMQPFVLQQNTLRTSTELSLFKNTASFDEANNAIGEGVSHNKTNFLTKEPRSIPSKQNILDDVPGNVVDRFRFRLKMSNNNYRFVSPLIDDSLTTMQAYDYRISNVPDATSNYVSKEIVLQPGYPATGLRVILSAFRPEGTEVDVYARFLRPQDPNEFTSWELLVNSDPDLYSSAANMKDYREFTHTYTEAATPLEYDAFQIKIVLRHTSSTLGSNVYPHVNDYRAIALT
jgi:hypothetical protein